MAAGPVGWQRARAFLQVFYRGEPAPASLHTEKKSAVSSRDVDVGGMLIAIHVGRRPGVAAPKSHVNLDTPGHHSWSAAGPHEPQMLDRGEPARLLFLLKNGPRRDVPRMFHWHAIIGGCSRA